MIKDGLKVTGSLTIRVIDQNGQTKDERQINNLVVTAGKEFIAQRMVGSPTAMSHMAVGVDDTAAAVGDTALGAEVARVALDSSTSSGAVVTHVGSFPAGTGTGALTEAGIFNAASSGTLQCRTVFPVVNKGADDAMSITWQITVS